MNTRLTAVLLVIPLVFLSFAGCSRQNDVSSPDVTTAPALPSASTMSMDVSFFQSAPVDVQAIKTGGYEDIEVVQGLESKLNFLNAAVRVHFLNLVVCLALVEPVAAQVVRALVEGVLSVVASGVNWTRCATLGRTDHQGWGRAFGGDRSVLAFPSLDRRARKTDIPRGVWGSLSLVRPRRSLLPPGGVPEGRPCSRRHPHQRTARLVALPNDR